MTAKGYLPSASMLSAWSLSAKGGHRHHGDVIYRLQSGGYAMRQSRWVDGLQFFASLGVLAGLILVAYEIRQNSDLAEADSVRAMLVGWQQIAMSEYETDIVNIHVKSIEDPENLTAVEIGKLSAWLTVVMNQYMLTFSMHERGLGYNYRDIDNGPEAELVGGFEYYFGSRFGRSWYIENKSWIDSELTEILDREMEKTPTQSSVSYAERIRSRL